MQDKAYGMLSARAYVHQYETYGLTLDEFMQSFAVVEDVLGAYGAM
jgi:tubulin delta